MTRTVAVIGGGVVGLCCALALERRGAAVTLIDAGPREQAASHVNAGWLVPTLSDPVPAPGLALNSVRWMTKRDSPLYIAPRRDPEFGRWLFDFWRACTTKRARAGLEATAALAAGALAAFDDLRADGVAFEEHRQGMLSAYRQRAALELDYAAARGLERFGFAVPPLLSGDETRALEPALTRGINGGFWHQEERSVRPDSLIDGLLTRLARGGTTLRLNERVTRLEAVNNRIRRVQTDRGTIETDAVVLAAGAWTPQLTKPLGLRLPIEAGKGYSIDFTPAPLLPAAITRPLYLHESRLAITPLDGMLRLAGTMELSGLNHDIRPERIRAIIHPAGDVIRGWPGDLTREGPAIQTWVGARPLTPDGLPVIGFLPGFANLAVASGHAMLGVTLAPVTANAIAELIDTGHASPLIRPFNPARFR